MNRNNDITSELIASGQIPSSILNASYFDSADSGTVCVKNIEATLVPLWRDEWYRNPSSGRSNNYGIETGNPATHRTLILKGGCYFPNEKCKKFIDDHNSPLPEVYGGLSLDVAKKEYAIAKLIQERFKSQLQKNANCPMPIDIHEVSGIMKKKNSVVTLHDFFVNQIEKEGKAKFTKMNFLTTALKLGIDISYPMSEHADEIAKKNPFCWMVSQCLEKSRQSIYRYMIDGANTRVLDLMTLNLTDRQKFFIEANTAANIREAIEKFSFKLGEFYGLLHQSDISYHGGKSEHCTLIDTTISGTIMDIGGLSQDNSVEKNSDAYFAQIFKTTNLVAYVSKHIMKVDDVVMQSALKTFWENYKKFYTDGNIDFLSSATERINLIRTRYLDAFAGDWITLAPDLKDLSYAG